MSLIIAGERSGAGKTTVTLALLACLRQWGLRVQSFKVGPDYIDPMFHQHLTGHACRNLDPILTSEAYVQSCFATHSRKAAYCLVEGVMGLFDGPIGGEDRGSTAHLARLLELPVLLVLDCSHLSGSVAAIAAGFCSFDPRLKFAGLVLNRVGSDRHLELLQAALTPLGLPILGVLRRQDEIRIPDRHLGLVPTAELPDFQVRGQRLADLGATCFDWPQLLPLLQTPTGTSQPPLPCVAQTGEKIRLAIARDRAFNFYYPDNLDRLEQLGAELIDWSPLQELQLPPAVQGLYFGGGFPEVFAAELAANLPARQAVKAAILAGMPTYAECGGLMYLCEQITDFDGHTWPMVGIVPSAVQMAPRLTLGYRRAIALQNSPLLALGEQVWGHEFHRSRLDTHADSPLFKLAGYGSTPVVTEGWQLHQLHASYLHLHWGDRPKLPQRFLHHCQRYLA